MRKIYGMIAIAMLMVSTSCSNVEDYPTLPNSNKVETYDNLKKDIAGLNVTYQATRINPLLRWLLIGTADVAGIFIDKKISGSVTASKFIWDITKEKTEKVDSLKMGNASKPVNALRRNPLNGLDPNSAGYIHNKVIMDLYCEYGDSIDRLSSDEIMDEIFTRVSALKNTTYSETDKDSLIVMLDKMTSVYDENKSITENMLAFAGIADDETTKLEMDVCAVILECLQCISEEEDGKFIEDANRLIEESALTEEEKASIKDGVSIAYASAKLWNTDALINEGENENE